MTSTPDEQLMDVFRNNLQQISKSRGVSQSELARRIGKTPSYICDIGRQRRRGITLATIAKIADGLGISADKLLKK